MTQTLSRLVTNILKHHRTSRNSKRIHWFNGRRIGWGTSHQQGFEKWAKLIQRPDLSPEFRAQIERNLKEKS